MIQRTEIDSDNFLEFIEENTDIFGTVKILKDFNVSSITEDMKNTTSAEANAYILPLNFSTNTRPELYIRNDQLIVSHNFFINSIIKEVYNKKFGLIASYKINIDNNDILTQIKTENIFYEREPYLGKKILHVKLKEIGKSLDAINTKRNKIAFKKEKGIISVEFNNDLITVKFNKTTYTKIIFDYDLNIIELDFSNSLKNKLNLRPLKNIRSYEDYVNKIQDNIEIHNLSYDQEYKLKTSSVDFKKQLKMLKIIIEKKDELIDLSSSIQTQIINLKVNKELTNQEKFKNKFTIKGIAPVNKVDHFLRHDLAQYYKYMNLLFNTKGTNDSLDLNLVNKIIELNEKFNIKKENKNKLKKTT